jgi:hypothetical protein
MKRNDYPIIIFVLTFVGAASVTALFWSPQNVSSLIAETDKSPSLQATNVIGKKPQISQTNPADVLIVKKYAENYEPKSTELQVIPSPPVPNEKVLKAISNLSNAESREHEKYIVLIFLRLHRFHIEHFKQSYDLDGNQLSKEFYRLTGENYNPNGEPKLSYLAENWVEANPELLKYSLIEKEMTRIEKAGEKIKKELEKTTKKQKKTSR